MSKNRNTSLSPDLLLLIFSIVLGIVDATISSYIYGRIRLNMWSPLAIGIGFTLFAFIFILGMVIMNIINGNLSYHLAKNHDGAKIAIILAATIVMVFILGTLFEFIYELNIFDLVKDTTESTSYVFIIDNSGSMSTSDPDGKRYQAVETIMSQKPESFPYAVYTFSDGVKEERALAAANEAPYDYNNECSGGTQIRTTLEYLFDEFEGGKKKELGSCPKFLLLSDGYATDISLLSSISGVLNDYANSPIAISTVGLGDVDDELMQQIADVTGGVYISVDDADMLEQSMSTAIFSKSDKDYERTLYTYRIVPKFDFIYALERIIFTAILGFIISFSVCFSSGKEEDAGMVLVVSIITALLAALILELGINAMAGPTLLIRYFYFILVALTVLTEAGVKGMGSGHDIYGEMDPFERRKPTLGQARGIGQNGSGVQESSGPEIRHSGGGEFDDFVSFSQTSQSDNFDSFHNFGDFNSSDNFDNFDDF